MQSSSYYCSNSVVTILPPLLTLYYWFALLPDYATFLHLTLPFSWMSSDSFPFRLLLSCILAYQLFPLSSLFSLCTLSHGRWDQKLPSSEAPHSHFVFFFPVLSAMGCSVLLVPLKWLRLYMIN
ncbi:uncharacterized protein [Spinacia oleracea]|uniref:Uncharacterized protein n=1 Tax=Spinacia oleracea TaxID=3562 RepID=A0ABM3RMK9_SPIOL|nr:uncharacterized protein LOC130470550 [Spinacia oleracea]